MRKFQVTVYVFRKVGCSNPEESTTLAALHRLDLQVISGIRMGRCFLLSVDAQDEIDAGQAAQTACKKSGKRNEPNHKEKENTTRQPSDG